MKTLRSLRARIEADPNIVDRGRIDVITLQSCMNPLIIGVISDLAVEDGAVMGTIEFSGQYADASRELFETNEIEPRLTHSVFGVCLAF